MVLKKFGLELIKTVKSVFNIPRTSEIFTCYCKNVRYSFAFRKNKLSVFFSG